MTKSRKDDGQFHGTRLAELENAPATNLMRAEPSQAGLDPKLKQGEVQLGYVPGEASSSAPVPEIDWRKKRPDDKPKKAQKKSKKAKQFGLTASDKGIRQTPLTQQRHERGVKKKQAEPKKKISTTEEEQTTDEEQP